MTDLHTRAVTLADADGTAPDVAEMIHDLLDALKAAPLSAAVATEAAAAVLNKRYIDALTVSDADLMSDWKSYAASAWGQAHAAIRALPQPTDADLDAAALARPVVRMMVKAMKCILEAAEAGDTDACHHFAYVTLAAAKGAAP